MTEPNEATDANLVLTLEEITNLRRKGASRPTP